MALTGVTKAHGPSPQPTTCSLSTTTGSNPDFNKDKKKWRCFTLDHVSKKKLFPFLQAFNLKVVYPSKQTSSWF